ncbi:hypothetical protein MKX03_012624 [Papaver bracteatum]|nr:hypothetical protein MKX03_012624 [Papaver bracteatum]
MKVIAAYLLAVLGGNKDPTIELLLSQIQGKDLTELVAIGREKLAVSGGGAPMEVNAVGDGAAAEQKKEEKVEEQIDEFTDSDDGSVGNYFFDDE